LRVKSAIWVGAYVRRVNAIPVAAMVVRRGDADAGAIYIKINTLDGNARVLRPAAAGTSGAEHERFWAPALKTPTDEARADAYIARQVDFDPDIWIIEIDDREGRDFLGDYLLKE
jgi:hypothetical protein